MTSIDPNNWIINKSDTVIHDSSFEVFPSPNNLPAIELTPNPTDGQFMLVAQSPGNHSLKMVDSNGKIVMEKSFGKEIDLDISQLAQGMYVVFVVSEFGTKDSAKIIKK